MCFFLEGRKVRKSTGTSNKRAPEDYDTARFRIAQGTYDEKARRDMTFIESLNSSLKSTASLRRLATKGTK